MIIGEAEYLFQTFDIKYTERENTTININPKNILQL